MKKYIFGEEGNNSVFTVASFQPLRSTKWHYPYCAQYSGGILSFKITMGFPALLVLWLGREIYRDSYRVEDNDPIAVYDQEIRTLKLSIILPVYVMPVVLDLESYCGNFVMLRRYCRMGYIEKLGQELTILIYYFIFRLPPSCYYRSTSVSSVTAVHFDVSESMRPPCPEDHHLIAMVF
ncbi:hypothetical protein AVEN_168663-1 [Araneus ventricosus]|uniref:Uncharacterized protein n=1 Tax=Araneus ventricosus TaxID=182803 RepID=A0A4Y2M071_ARAVE|nr:hypothetical protein AVEN_168663-1 [Araneus ventricosus]